MQRDRIIQIIIGFVLIFLIGFIFANVLFLINQEKAPEFIQNMIISEAEFSQKVIYGENHESEINRLGSSCSGSTNWKEYPLKNDPREII